MTTPFTARFTTPFTTHFTALACTGALLLALSPACSDDAPDPGALVAVSMTSIAGVLLDEVPESARGRATEELVAKPAAFWEGRVRRHIETTLYRLVYRNDFYEGLGQLPLPPVESWQLAIDAPRRATIGGHDLVVVDFTMTGTLLTGVGEPGKAEPMLAETGGVWDEPFVLPIDPEHLLERVGFACMDEADFPPNSVDTENARLFFDDLCEAGEHDCHVTLPLPTRSCIEAIDAEIGRVDTKVRFERLAWNQATADRARIGEQVQGGAQLKALQEGVEDNRIVYRWFGADSCAITEGCVGAGGWRRLLQFTATMQNLGAVDAAIGDVGPDSLPVRERLVSYSECHQHMHFSHYGNFAFGTGEQALGSKRAFCLESTARYFNNEDTPLTHPYGCDFQGTAAGWGDDYIAGLDCQWVDITPVDSTGGVTAPLTFHINPDKFLCEGQPQRDASGNLIFLETAFLNEAGENEKKIACDELPGSADDNIATAEVTVPEVGGMVDSPCVRELYGDTRNCDFKQQGAIVTCTPGALVTLSCTVNNASAPQAVRVCEASSVLGALPCVYLDALATAQAGGTAATLSFTCPPLRDATEPGGRYAVYRAGVLPSDSAQMLTCM